MSYKSFAEQEMALVGTPKHIRKSVQRAIKNIDAMGHSGASIDIYSGMIANWLRASHGLKTQEDRLEHVAMLPEQFRAALVDLSIEDTVTMVILVNALMRFEPLTPLTGADDEWINVHDDMYQNRRCGSVFKEGRDGKAYHLDRVLYAYPTENFTGWSQVGRGNGLSSRAVEFPYDVQASDNRQQINYFTHDDWETPLPMGIEPNTWLNWMHSRYIKGIDPSTNRVRESAMFIRYDGDTDGTNSQFNFFDRLINLLCYLKYNGEISRDGLIERLRWLGEYNEPFQVEWSEPADETDDTYSYCAMIADQPIAYALARMLALIHPDWQYMVSGQQFLHEDGDDWHASLFWDPIRSKEVVLDWRVVMVTTNTYQRWMAVKRNSAYFRPETTNHLTDVAVPVFRDRDATTPAFYYDDGYKITGDEENYLYHKRRTLGLPHPRNKFTVTLPENDTNPELTINALAKTAQGVALDPQEAEHIDDVVAKHVGKVFGTGKKD